MAAVRIDVLCLVLAFVTSIVCILLGFFLKLHGMDGGVFIGAAFPSASQGVVSIARQGFGSGVEGGVSNGGD